MLNILTQTILKIGHEHILSELAEKLAQGVLDTISEECVVTYTFDDPEGTNFHYTDLDDLISDLGSRDEGNGTPWAINTQLELPGVLFVHFKDGKQVLAQ